MDTQIFDTGLPAASVALIGVVVTASVIGIEQVQPGKDAVEGVRASCSPIEESTIPTESSG